MAVINRNLFTYKTVCPRWFLMLVLLSALFGSLFFCLIEPLTAQITPSGASTMMATGTAMHQTISMGDGGFDQLSPAARMISFFLIGFCVVVEIFSALVFFREMPVLWMSSNPERVATSAGMIKTSMWLFGGSLVVMLATYGVTHWM